MKRKQKQKMIRTSILFWLGVFMLYAAVFVPLAPKIAEWPQNIKVTVLVLAIVFPLTAQIAIIFRSKG